MCVKPGLHFKDCIEKLDGVCRRSLAGSQENSQSLDILGNLYQEDPAFLCYKMSYSPLSGLLLCGSDKLDALHAIL